MVEIDWLFYFVIFFNACLVYGYLPPVFTVPIIKNKAGQLSDVNNYRAIAIANACSKVLESIIYKYVIYIFLIL